MSFFYLKLCHHPQQSNSIMLSCHRALSSCSATTSFHDLWNFVAIHHVLIIFCANERYVMLTLLLLTTSKIRPGLQTIESLDHSFDHYKTFELTTNTIYYHRDVFPRFASITPTRIDLSLIYASVTSQRVAFRLNSLMETGRSRLWLGSNLVSGWVLGGTWTFHRSASATCSLHNLESLKAEPTQELEGAWAKMKRGSLLIEYRWKGFIMGLPEKQIAVWGSHWSWNNLELDVKQPFLVIDFVTLIARIIQR